MSVTKTRREEEATLSLWDEGPSGFDAGDANLRRVVGNDPTNATDPSGLYMQLTREKRPNGTIALFVGENGIQTAFEGLFIVGGFWRVDRVGPISYVGYLPSGGGTIVWRDGVSTGVDVAIVEANVSDESIKDWGAWLKKKQNEAPFRDPNSAAGIASRQPTMYDKQDAANGVPTAQQLYPIGGTNVQSKMQAAINTGAQAAHDSMRGHLIMAGGISATGVLGSFFAVDVIPNQRMVRVGEPMTQAQATEAVRNLVNISAPSKSAAEHIAEAASPIGEAEEDVATTLSNGVRVPGHFHPLDRQGLRMAVHVYYP